MYTYLVFTLTYTFWSSISFITDIYGSDDMIQNKIGTKDRSKLLQLYKKILPRVVFNVYIATLPLIYFDLYIDYNIGMQFNLFNSLIHIFLSVVMSEILFYTFHRISHHKFLYKRFHKIHHELKEPIGMGAVYTHWLDAILGVYIPDGIPIFLLYAHPYTVHFWIFLTTSVSILMAHSNYKDLSEYHDDHHRLSCVNFGNGFFMDKIFRTEKTSNRNRRKTFIKAKNKFASEVKSLRGELNKVYKDKYQYEVASNLVRTLKNTLTKKP